MLRLIERGFRLIMMLVHLIRRSVARREPEPVRVNPDPDEEAMTHGVYRPEWDGARPGSILCTTANAVLVRTARGVVELPREQNNGDIRPIESWFLGRSIDLEVALGGAKSQSTKTKAKET